MAMPKNRSTHTGLRRCIVGLLIAFLGASCSDPLSPSDEYQHAVSAAERWVAAHPASWTLSTVGLQVPRRESWSTPCSANPASGFVTLRVQTPLTRLSVAFRCAPGAPDGTQAMRDAFSHVVIEELPHGLAVPNWRFTVLTPMSSFSSGVEILDAPGGGLRFEIATMLYALYGQSTRPSCLPPQDGSAAPGCYVHMEHRIPLSLSVHVPRDGAMFR